MYVTRQAVNYFNGVTSMGPWQRRAQWTNNNGEAQWDTLILLLSMACTYMYAQILVVAGRAGVLYPRLKPGIKVSAGTSILAVTLHKSVVKKKSVTFCVDSILAVYSSDL